MIRALFSRMGELVYCTVMTDRETGRCRGTGRVEFATPEMAGHAIKGLNGTDFNGRCLTVRAFEDTGPQRHRGVDGLAGAGCDPRKIFVGGISRDMDIEQLRGHFAHCGDIVFACLFTDRETGRSKGAGKIEFATQEAAQRAIAELSQSQIDGRPITVKALETVPLLSGRQRSDAFGHVGHRPRADSDGRTLFVGGLSSNTTTDVLRGFFARCGKVSSVTIFTDHDAGRPRCAGKVQLASIEAAQHAIAEMSGSELDGHSITVHLMGETPVLGERLPEVPGSRPNSRLPGCERLGNRGGAQGCTVFVGGLRWDTDEGSLRDHFSQVGVVSFAQVFMDRGTGRSRGAGKVQFVTADAFRIAIEELNGSELDGRTITVRVMEERGSSQRSLSMQTPERAGRQVLQPRQEPERAQQPPLTEKLVATLLRHRPRDAPDEGGWGQGPADAFDGPQPMTFADDIDGRVRGGVWRVHGGVGVDVCDADPVTDCPTDF